MTLGRELIGKAVNPEKWAAATECDSPANLGLGPGRRYYLWSQPARSDFLAAIFFPFFRLFFVAMDSCLHLNPPYGECSRSYRQIQCQCPEVREACA
jgi:hypothetical protein